MGIFYLSKSKSKSKLQKDYLSKSTKCRSFLSTFKVKSKSTEPLKSTLSPNVLQKHTYTQTVAS